MEDLDYFIRTLTYKRSCLEIDIKKQEQGSIAHVSMLGEHKGIQTAITEIYKLIKGKEK